MARIQSIKTANALGAIPPGAEMMAWEVVFGDSRRPMVIGNLLANDVGRISTGCSNAFVRLLTQSVGGAEFDRALRALRERLQMMEAVAMLAAETRASLASDADG